MTGYIYFALHREYGLVKIASTTQTSMVPANDQQLQLLHLIEVEDVPRVMKYLRGRYTSHHRTSDLFEIPLEDVNEEVDFLRGQLSVLPSTPRIEAVRHEVALEAARAPTEEQKTLFEYYLEYKEQLSLLEFLMDNIKLQLIDSIGRRSGITGYCTYKLKRRTSIDTQRLRNELPDVYSSYATSSQFREFRLKVDSDL